MSAGTEDDDPLICQNLSERQLQCSDVPKRDRIDHFRVWSAHLKEPQFRGECLLKMLVKLGGCYARELLRSIHKSNSCYRVARSLKHWVSL